jgi:uncharacterized membrane protein
MLPIEHFHPMLVHFPIVLIMLLLLTDATALVRGVPLSGHGGYAIVSAGLAVLAGVSAVLTALLGDVAAEIAIDGGVAKALIEPHEDLGFNTAIALGVWALVRAFLWWRGTELTGKRVLGVVGVEAVLCGMVLVAAYFGGQLVYEHGVNVTMPGTMPGG